mmetsp:Transcript_8114/g.15057  ORF Transcript_8114/g.15057 Transcript_8114/m.15057 type:complete len:308 (+) Transcript_8114:318-1241(+)
MGCCSIGDGRGKMQRLQTAASEGDLQSVLMIALSRQATAAQLHEACNLASRHGQLDVVRYLVENGPEEILFPPKNPLPAPSAHPSSASIGGGDCLSIAAFRSQMKVVRYLVEDAKAQLHGYHLKAAASGGSLEVLRYLIAETTLEKKVDSLEGDDNLLIVATGRADPEMVAYLVKEVGIPLDGRSSERMTALHMCCEPPLQAEIAAILVEAGAGLNILDSRQNTALVYAIRAKSLKTVKLLVEYKADPLLDGGSKSPLKWAQDAGDEDIENVIKEALKRNALGLRVKEDNRLSLTLSPKEKKGNNNR